MSAHAPNTLQLELKDPGGDAYQIQVAWPLAWNDPKTPGHSASIIYVLDGNALFFTATEASRRSAMLPTSDNAVVVGIGYPIEDRPYSPRRQYDYTPPCDSYVAPCGIDGEQQAIPHGGATRFLEFLVGTVRTTLLAEVFSSLCVNKEILIGHSLGGLCTLHALFENITPFDIFIAISPSIWWSNEFILGEAERFLKQRMDGGGPESSTTLPTLIIIYGNLEQDRRCHPSWSEDKYRRVKALSQERKMKDNADALANCLRQSGRLQKVRVKEYRDEDHGSVVGAGISWAIGAVLDDGRFFSDGDD
ncbi:Alpha/Beta hydrolase protein [Aspergillus pseudocaelatus]|uniref:Alpha/Beta hydrolase protein n=1 Tax=Aspergillus pseudocaelatus TaxID=1825620 RepID=A0ABQ6X2T1_9EURO|nr:Alpha/Beta hydrolase protein [Aspergillus pseudocaelatus]